MKLLDDSRTPLNEKLDAFARILRIMDELREQCPWDRKQTMESLRSLTIEETYELADAILEQDDPAISEELGDILLHIVFYARLGEEKGSFDIASLIHKECEKLIHRHPHIYGDTKVEDEEEVKRNWEQLKLAEKEKKGEKKTVLGGVPRSLPSVIKALRIQEKAAQVGFDWEHIDQVWDKVEEEKQELNEAVNSKDQKHTEEEFGDLMFALINYARFLKIDPETALESANRKFMHRFNALEERVNNRGLSFSEMNLAQMDAIWDEVKKES
jgi:XTP/dITP diphosphohydrolase